MLKAAFVLLIAVFGAAMFAAGALAPAQLKTPLENLAAKAAAMLGTGGRLHQAAESAGKAAASRSASASTTSGPVGGAPAAASGAAYAASTPMANLLVPSVPPAKARYALQAATFASGDAAALFASSVTAQGYKATIIPVSDADQPFIVTVGDYTSPDAASADQLPVEQALKSTTLPPVVMLPPSH